MNAHRVLVLGVVAVVALGAALWSSQTRRPAQEVLASQPLVAGLEAGINEVSQVRVRLAGDALQATLKRVDGGGWVLTERDDYPVDVNVLRQYLLKLARAKRVEAKTDNPALYYRLGVEEIGAKDVVGAQVELDGLAQPIKLIIGRNVVRGTGSYVRHAGEAQSWQVDADLAVERVAANWLQRDLVDIAAGRVQRVHVTPAAGPAVEIVRAAEGSAGDFALASLPKGREAATDFVADAAAGFLSGLRFDDVLRATDATPPETGVTRATFATQEGISIEVAAWPEGDKARAQFTATLDESVAGAFVAEAQAKAARERAAVQAQAAATLTPVREDSAEKTSATETAATDSNAAKPAVSEPVKDSEQRLAALRAEIAAMNARFKDKTFVLPAFKAGNLTKTLEGYLKPKA